MAVICDGCKRSVEPVKLFEESPKPPKQWWLISRCPFERCGYNIDIEKYDKPGSDKDKKDKRRSFWKGDHWE